MMILESVTMEDVAKNPPHSSAGRATPAAWNASLIFRITALSAGYIVLYLTLDRLSFIEALHGIGITPWSPSSGLAMALLIVKGMRCAPLLMVAEGLSAATLPAMPVSAAPVFLEALVVTALYSGAASILRHAGLQAGIRGSADAVTLLIVIIVNSGLVAGGFVGAYAAAGIVPWTGFYAAAFHFWIGDAIGVVVLTPPLLLLYQPSKQRTHEHRRWGSTQLAELAAQEASVVAALAAVFTGVGDYHGVGQFYLLFPPLIWIAMRHGLSLTSWTVLAIQVGLIVGLEIQGHSEVSLQAFQLFMFALAATGLVLGAVVSERRRLSFALVDSEGHRAAILNTVPDGVLTIDEGGRIQSINPAVERLFARPSHQLIGHYLSELIEGMSPILDRLLPDARPANPYEHSWELNARRSDGSTFPIEFSAGRFEQLGSERYTVVIRDISARRKAEARVREHEAELAHVSRVSLAGEMAAGLAHELSQPLTAITAYARGCLRLLAGPVPETAMLHEGIAEVVQQAERAGDVLSRLREFVRGREHQRALIEVGPLIEDAVSLMRMEAMRRRVEIEPQIDPNLPTVLADQIQIQQVLLNLLRNAIDAIDGSNTEHRSIVIKARYKSTCAVEISVADSGPGIAAEVTETLFDPFVTTKPLGMGMGLSISRSIVESHGGNLQTARAVPFGAIFFFDLSTAEAATDAG
jgi:two-component system, LuxR family, sensor kinase FixL